MERRKRPDVYREILEKRLLAVSMGDENLVRRPLKRSIILYLKDDGFSKRDGMHYLYKAHLL